MSKKDPLRQFFKTLKKIEEDLQKFSQSEKGYWPFNYECEIEKSNLIKFNDFLYHTKVSHPPRTCIFLWQVHPNYTCWGQPGYTEDRRKEILSKSELRKDLIKYGDLTFSLTRSGFQRGYPNANIWGLKISRHEMAIFQKVGDADILIFQTSVKKHLTDWWEENKARFEVQSNSDN